MPEVDLDAFTDIRNDTEFTFCEECLFWKLLGEDSLKRCWKNAPNPGIQSSLDSTAQEVVWPATKAIQGCFEGVSKFRVLVPSDGETEDTCYGCGEGSCVDCIGPHNPENKKLQKLLNAGEVAEKITNGLG